MLCRAPARRCFAAAAAVAPGDAAAFARVAGARRCAARFDAARGVPRAAMRAVLEATLRTPSSFNLLAYRVELAEDARVRARVADAMLGGGNAARVRAAPLAAAFFADADAMSGVDELLAREARAGARPPAYLRSLRTNAALFASSRGGGCAEAGARRALGAALRVAGAASGAPMPAPPADGGAVWAAKGTSLAAMSFMLAATAHGLATYPMEGFDGGQLARALGVDGARWRALFVVATGYEAPAEEGAPPPPPRSTRPPLRAVFALDGRPFESDESAAQ
jgi:nitroreductase